MLTKHQFDSACERTAKILGLPEPFESLPAAVQDNIRARVRNVAADMAIRAAIEASAPSLYGKRG